MKNNIIDRIIVDDCNVIGFSSNMFTLNGARPVYIGKDSLVKVCVSVGLSKEGDIKSEFKKSEKLCALSYRPDIINDLSIVKTSKPLYRFLLENFDGAIGLVPYYTLFSNNGGINRNELMETIQMQLEEGVAYMTLHLTADTRLYELACNSNRKIPFTSRGGFCLIKDAYINRRNTNILIENLDEILKLFKKYNATISIGGTFRPATIWDAMDSIQRKEIQQQKEYIKLCKKYGVNVILEGLGHASLRGIDEYLNNISDVEVPLMPLGPLPSDELIGFDHITNAIGAFYMSKSPWLSIINSITRKEHMGDIPSLKDTVEALKTARATAHIINCNKSSKYMDYMETTGLKRAIRESCLVSGGIFKSRNMKKCSRCGRECPYNAMTLNAMK